MPNRKRVPGVFRFRTHTDPQLVFRGTVLRPFISVILLGSWLTACAEEGPTWVGESELNIPSAPVSTVDWLAQNGKSISSLTSEDYSDLQFLKTSVGDRQIVQLGESTYGTEEYSRAVGAREFNQAKVRLAKFLHEEMGFDVIAFESSLFECFDANRRVDELSAISLMKRCIYRVWQTEEVLLLFQYIKETQETDRPLTLAGFDIKPSVPDFYWDRGEFLRDVVERLDPEFAEEVERWETRLLHAVQGKTKWYLWNGLADEADELSPFYEKLLSWFDLHRDELASLYTTDRGIPFLARQLVWTTLNLFKFSQDSTSPLPCPSWETRDLGMAANLGALIRNIYPQKKTIVWSQNAHIRHDNNSIELSNFSNDPRYNSLCSNMGEQLFGRFWQREGIYTIGLHANEAVSTNFDGYVSSSGPALPDYLEGQMALAGDPYFFLDFPDEPGPEVPSWLTSPVLSLSHAFGSLRMVPQDQYDGLLFIDKVGPPTYIPSNVW